MAASCCVGAGALHKIDGIMRWENYVDILKQHLKTSVRKLKLGRNTFNTHTFKVVAKWLKGNKVKVLAWPSQSPHPIENVWAELKKHVASKEAYKHDSVTPALSEGMGHNSPNLL